MTRERNPLRTIFTLTAVSWSITALVVTAAAYAGVTAAVSGRSGASIFIAVVAVTSIVSSSSLTVLLRREKRRQTQQDVDSRGPDSE